MSLERCLEYKEWNHSVYQEYDIPSHLFEGLDRYFKQGLRPGGFLYAVLTNDLKDAMLRWAGGGYNPASDLVKFFCAEVPAPSWGSVDAVEKWIENHAAERRRKAREAALSQPEDLDE